ncbi:MAG TPA: c-type cytochrome [Xanthobacteraceae bacterium]
MMRWLLLLTFLTLDVSAGLSPTLAEQGNANNGQRIFGTCAACHSLQPNRSMTGPSLANLWNRKAGSLTSFPRYSSALKSSAIVWNDETLNDWIKDPQHLIPGNEMTFPGIKNDQRRADVLAFLKEATQAGHAPLQSAQNGQMGGIMGGGGMTGGTDLDLKAVGPEHRVQAISYCHDTFRVTTADGHTRAFWQRNLRLMVDSSDKGPEKGAPAIVGAGMMGDRADAIFASPQEISGFIKQDCS